MMPTKRNETKKRQQAIRLTQKKKYQDSTKLTIQQKNLKRELKVWKKPKTQK